MLELIQSLPKNPSPQVGIETKTDLKTDSSVVFENSCFLSTER